MIPMADGRKIRHPGRILQEDYLSRLPEGATQADVADRLGMSRPRLNELLREKRGITPDTAMRLSRAFGTTAEFWMEAQAAWDLHVACRSRRRVREIERIEPWVEAPAAMPRPAAAAAPAPVRGPREADALLSLPVEIALLQEGLPRSGSDAIGSYYEMFLENRGLLADAQRFARIQAQLDALSARPEAPRRMRPLRVSPPALYPRPVQGELTLG